ncbi:nucleotide binding protein, PINc [Stanieria sp. NIES-3757]|nr:nucleotide binding protein, PINc [Stanieria sp. NIES-3757]
MKVIIDTNILVSAALKNRQPEQVVLLVASNYQWLVSTEILQEYEQILSRKKLNIDQDKRSRFIRLIKQLTNLVEVNSVIDFPRDRKDAKFLACAMAAKADFLITGDRDFSEAQQLIETKIISVREFIELFQPR